MTVAPAQPAHIRTPTHIAPIAAWLLIQMLALLLPVLQVPLSDSFPRPAESMALYEMLTVQVALSALLFPSLMPDLAAAAIVITGTWPFILLAGTLAAAQPAQMLFSGLYMACWLALLGMWRFVLPSNRWRMLAVALAAVLSIGGGVLWYLRAEFVTEKTDSNPLLGPIAAVLSILNQEKPAFFPWIFVISALAFSVALAFFVKRYRAKRQLIHH